MTTIELFAKAKFDIDLTLAQMQMLRAWSTGSDCNLIKMKNSGASTARRVWYAYMQDAVKEEFTDDL